MDKQENLTARYKIIKDAGGSRYCFYCDLSGIAISTTKAYSGSTRQEELLLAWQSEGKQFFNQCHKCGRWVCDAMYNADVLECVVCAPWEDNPLYCPNCGTKRVSNDNLCRNCGAKLQYGEVTEDGN